MGGVICMNMNEKKKLMNRFIRDNYLPIKTCIGLDYSFACLKSYDNLMGTNYLMKWGLLCDFVERKWDSDVESYLEQYNRVIQDVVKAIQSNKQYSVFKDSKVELERPKVGESSVYKETNIGKYFLSLDIKQANYSVMKKEGIFKEEDWQQFISKYTMIPEIINSKYMRQVILGQCNPKKQGQYELKHMIQIYDMVNKVFNYSHAKVGYNIVSLTNDEIVLELLEPERDIHNVYANATTICAYSMRELGIPMHWCVYKLVSVAIDKKPEGCGMTNGYCRKILKADEKGKQYDFKDVSKRMYSLLYAVNEGRPPIKEDYLIETDYGIAELKGLPTIKTDWLREIKS